MKNNISISIEHPNAKRMEFFLNAVKEELTEVPVNWQDLKLADRMSGACRFVSTGENPVTITVFLCDSYSDGNDIAKANALPYTPKAKWSLNGGLMYLVESEDEDKVGEILSLFAGKE